MSQQASDAAFYDIAHNALDKRNKKADDGSERRGTTRHPYNCVQLVAPYDGERLPVQADFRRVLCQDISASGFSFFTPRKPETPYVVIALGPIPFKFYSAEIMHADPVNNEGMAEYLVGCRLVNRITGEQSG